MTSRPTTGKPGTTAPSDAADSTGAITPAARELRQRLQARPITIPPRWLYDDRGSELFADITRLPEYYQTEAERRLLADHAALIAEITSADTVIELGSGIGDKTRTLLDAFVAHGELRRFVPLDVSEATLLRSAAELRERYPDLDVEPVVADFTEHLHLLPDGATRLVMFLGGTIGTFYREERSAFLGALADVLRPGDWVGIGIDLMKPVDRIMAAYDDDAGLTDAFVRNVLHVVNRELDGDLDVGNFEYVPLWVWREERVDMRLRACEPEHATIGALGVSIDLEAGEELRVEISTKFRPERFGGELDDAGFCDVHTFTDGDEDFGLVLARRR